MLKGMDFYLSKYLTSVWILIHILKEVFKEN